MKYKAHGSYKRQKVRKKPQKPPKLFQLLQKIRLACAFFDLFVPLSNEIECKNIFSFCGYIYLSNLS